MVYYPGCRTRARFVKCRIKKITIITISYANTTINPPTFGFLKGAKIFDNSTNIEIGTVVNVIKRTSSSINKSLLRLNNHLNRLLRLDVEKCLIASRIPPPT